MKVKIFKCSKSEKCWYHSKVNNTYTVHDGIGDNYKLSGQFAGTGMILKEDCIILEDIMNSEVVTDEAYEVAITSSWIFANHFDGELSYLDAAYQIAVDFIVEFPSCFNWEAFMEAGGTDWESAMSHFCEKHPKGIIY